jgi:hypothetical protein
VGKPGAVHPLKRGRDYLVRLRETAINANDAKRCQAFVSAFWQAKLFDEAGEKAADF